MASRRQVKIVTGARLHFGLLRPTAPFGGAGVMINAPAGEVRITPADRFACDPAHESRVIPIAKRLIQRIGVAEFPACNVSITGSLAAHCGLGSGTQWSLAVAEGLGKFLGVEIDQHELATQIADRGKRSAVGVHGYFRGGLIHESSVAGSIDLNPIVERIELPSRWRVVFLVPEHSRPAVSGVQEADYFDSLGRESRHLSAQLEDCLRERLMPAARAADFDAFSRALHDYNRSSGMLFAKVQGGPFNGPQVTRIIDQLRRRGIVGAGQSSWGPGVFAWFPNSRAAQRFALDPPDDAKILATTTVRQRGRQTDFE